MVEKLAEWMVSMSAELMDHKKVVLMVVLMDRHLALLMVGLKVGEMVSKLVVN